MADMLQAGTVWLAAQLNQHAAGTVTYTRGAQSVGVSAVVVQQPLQVTDGMGGLGTEWDNTDFLVDAADLVILGVQIEPQRGDRIARTLGGVTVTYEVMAPLGEAAWRWADSYGVTRRIHAKKVG
jgi:hypothetical protein